MGGRSAEREVSLRTGQAVHQALLRRGYDSVAIDADVSVLDQLRANKVEMVFLALHGPGGEDGTIQGLLETAGIPYTGSGVRASAIAMHKATAKALLSYHGISVPRGAVVQAEEGTNGSSIEGRGQSKGREPRLPAGLKFPVVVKPASQGSTIGVTIVRKPSEWQPALNRAHAYDREALVEAYIPGREVTVSVLNGVVPAALPPVEVVAPGGFYDYAAKYEKGRTRYVCPAPLSAAVTKRVQGLAVRACALLGCDGAARVDFRVTPRGRPYVLEVNTIPGMTETSLLPMAAAQAGLDYESLTERILQSAIRRAGRLPVER
jgi:D-alanine-D-alanine ligase